MQKTAYVVRAGGMLTNQSILAGLIGQWNWVLKKISEKLIS
jgi:hypothetical protein